jgi:uncharacterized NAD(P)/FAD-binding protein YdhS
MAPEIGAKIAAARASGRIVVHAGRLQRLDSGVRATISLRTNRTLTLDIQRVINCTGSEEDYAQTANPLVRSLLASGRIAPNRIAKGYTPANTESCAMPTEQLPAGCSRSVRPASAGCSRPPRYPNCANKPRRLPSTCLR